MVHYGVHQHVSGDTEFTFDEWNRLRYEDGMLCRNDFDCSWIDHGFYCKRGKLGFKPEAGFSHKVRYDEQHCTLWVIPSVVMFCYVFFRKFRLPIKLNNNCNISPTAGGTCKKYFKKHLD